MQRRNVLALTGAALLLASCGDTPGSPAVTFDQVKAYVDAGVAALDAAAQQFLMGPPAPSAANAVLVQQIIGALDQTKTALDGVTVPADYKAGLMQAIALIQQLAPMVTLQLGAAAQYIPLVIAVAQAFIAALPPPADAPPTPPAALARKGAEYKPKHH
jgi:hypothetical protein